MLWTTFAPEVLFDYRVDTACMPKSSLVGKIFGQDVLGEVSPRVRIDLQETVKIFRTALFRLEKVFQPVLALKLWQVVTTCK